MEKGKVTIKKGTKETLLINQILVRPLWRMNYDIDKWREAIKMSDLDRRQYLYRIYDDMMLDGVLSRSIEKRIEAITNSDLVFTDQKGKEVGEITNLIDTAKFEDMLSEIILTKFWGTTCLEFDFSNGFDFYSIPRRNIRPKARQIAIDENDEFGIPIENDENIIILGKNNDMGILMKASQYVIYKRGGFGDWAQYVELFGMPQRIGKYTTTDPESRAALIQAFEQAGSAPFLVVPKDTEVDTVLNKGVGNSTLYDSFRKACNEELTICILGNTLTTTQGDKGSQALGRVHSDVEDEVHNSDRRFVQRILNNSILPLLEKRGFPVKGGSFSFPLKEEELDITDYVALSSIMPVPISYLQNKFNIPEPKNNEPIAGIKISEPPKSPPITQQEGTGGTDQIPPSSNKGVQNNDDKNLIIRLFDFFVHPRHTTGAPLEF